MNEVEMQKKCDEIFRMLLVDMPLKVTRSDVVFFIGNEKGNGVILDYANGIKPAELSKLYPAITDCYQKDGYFLLRCYDKEFKVVTNHKYFTQADDNGNKEWRFSVFND